MDAYNSMFVGNKYNDILALEAGQDVLDDMALAAAWLGKATGAMCDCLAAAPAWSSWRHQLRAAAVHASL